MKVEIDVVRLEKLGLTPDEYIYLYKLFTEYPNPILLRIDKKILSEKGYIIKCIPLSVYKITELGEKLFKTPEVDWIDEYRDLFPVGIKSGGLFIKGDRNGCLKKMKAFVKKYPEYTKEIILKGTKNYLDAKKKENYNYCTVSHYFIDKDGISLLASYCEQVNEKPVQETDLNKTIKGDSNFEI